MAATFQATGTAASGIGNITVAWPTHQINDIGLLILESTGGQAANLATANGFTAVANSPVSTGTGTSGTRLTAYWARATSTTMSSPVVTDPGNHCCGVIVTFRNCAKNGNPWTTTNTATKAAASTTHTMATIATVHPNQLVVLACTADGATAAWVTSWTCSDLTSLTERFDGGYAVGNSGGIALASGTCATPKTIVAPTLVMTSYINASMTLALRGTEEACRGWQIT